MLLRAGRLSPPPPFSSINKMAVTIYNWNVVENGVKQIFQDLFNNKSRSLSFIHKSLTLSKKIIVWNVLLFGDKNVYIKFSAHDACLK